MVLMALMTFILAADFTPQGNINLRDTYNITNIPYLDGYGLLGNILGNTTTNMTSMDYIIANYFQGDGSGITGVSGANVSWNQTHAEAVFYSILNPFSFYNVTSPQPNTFSYYNITNPMPNTFSYYNVTDPQPNTFSYYNSTSPQTETDPVCSAFSYYNVTNPQPNTFSYYNVTSPQPNTFSYYNVTSPDPNTFSYYNSTDFSIADYYLDNNPESYYNVTSLVELDPVSAAFGYYNSTNPQTETDPISAAFSYYNSTDFSISDYYLDNNPESFYNVTSLVETDPVSAAFGYYNSTNPQTETDPISAAFGYYNSTNPQTETDPISAAFGYYNSTDFSISNYYNKTYVYNQTEIDDLNTTMATYVDAQDVIYNSSAANYTDSKLITTYYNASAIQAKTGTGQGAIGDLQTYNGVAYNISEVNSDFDLRVNFTSVTGANQLVYRYKSEDDEPHIMHVQIWDYGDSAWEGYAEEGAREHFGIFTYGIYDEDDHISGGLVQVRFYTTNGAPQTTHKWQFDWVTITDGPATPSSSESDPFSVRKDGTTPLTANWDAGAYNITAQYFNGSGEYLTGVYFDTNPFGFYNSTNPQTETDPICSAFGYYNSTDFSISDYYLDNNPEGYYNSTSLPGGSDSNETTRVNAIVGTNCTGTDKYSKIYDNGTLICSADEGVAETLWSSNYTAYNSSWSSIQNDSYYLITNPFSFYNVTNPQTETDPISAAFGYYNSTNPQTETDPICSAFGYYNSTNPQTETDPISAAFSYYNSTDFSIADYYLDNNPEGYYNSTSLVETDPISAAFSYYNSTDFSISDYYLDNNPEGFYNVTSLVELDPISAAFGYYNSTNPQTETDPICSAFGYYNSTSPQPNTFSYYNVTSPQPNTFSYYNVTTPQPNTFSYYNNTASANFSELNVSAHFKINTVNITCLDGLCNWYSNATDSCMYWPSGGKDCGAA